MKAIITTLALIISPLILLAQAPEKISYQAIIRGNDAEPLRNQSIGMEISILLGSVDGPEVYSETHAISTNGYGLINLEIGTGETQGVLSEIDWSQGPYFIKSASDPNGGSQYELVGVSQILSVPYALHANIADSVSIENDPLYLNSTAYNISAEDTVFWNNKLSEEFDPQFNNSTAAAITVEDTSYWNNKLDQEIDGSIENEIQAFSVSTTGDTLRISNSNFVIIPGISFANYPTNETPVILSVNVSLESVTEGTNITVTINVDDPFYTNVNFVDYYIANSSLDPVLSVNGTATFTETDPGVFQYTNTLLLANDYPSGQYAIINVIVKNEDNIEVYYDSFTYFTITH